MTREELIKQIFAKKSFLCVGLDTDPKKIPVHIIDRYDPIFEFNKEIKTALRNIESVIANPSGV